MNIRILTLLRKRGRIETNHFGFAWLTVGGACVPFDSRRKALLAFLKMCGGEAV